MPNCFVFSFFSPLISAFFMFSFIAASGNSFPKKLTPEEEKKYLTEFKNGSEDARNVLVERNLRLVAHVVKKFSMNQKDTEDLISIGTIGLIKGVTTFNPDKGARLATYAAKCIENAILFYMTHIIYFMHLCEKNTAIRTF